MRFFAQQHTYYHDWSTVTAAFWQKYPNTFQPHVLRVDTLDKTLDVPRKTLQTWRLFSLNYHIPTWIQSIINIPDIGYGVEHAICNAAERRLTLKSSNVTFSRFFQINELCEYVPHPANPDKWTLYTQRAEYKIGGFGMISTALESAVVQSATEKAKHGLEAVQAVIQRLECHQQKKWLPARECLEQAKQSFEQAIHMKRNCVDTQVFNAKRQLETTMASLAAPSPSPSAEENFSPRH